MRGVAAICVLVGHVLLFSYSTGGLYELGRWLAPFGLVIFFTISGFLLYRPFLAARQVGEPVGELTPSYLWRRAVRILPAYWVALTVSALWLNWTEVLSGHWWVYYGMLQAYSPHWVLNGIAPAWSLCVEITFYLALPLIALTLADVGLGSGRPQALRWELGVLGVVALLSIAWRVSMGTDASTHYLVNTLLGCLAWFCAGMLLAAVEVIHPRRLGSLRSVLSNPALCWLLAAALFVLMPLGVPAKLGLAPGVQVLAEVLLLGIAGLLLLAPAVLSERSGVVSRLLENRLAVFVGTISYGIYLWHWAFLNWFAQREFVLSSAFPATLLALGTLTGAVLAGTASWYLIEKPLMQRARSVKAFRHVRRGQVEVASEG
jgi:peptidoglycan/LPS O-acetylase OafA/YrhL